MSMDKMFALILLLLVLGIIIICSIFLSIINKFINIYNTNTNRSLDLSTKYEESDLKIIDILIEETFTEFRVTQLEYIDDLYITEELQNTILKELLTKVLLKISPALRHKLGLYYNPSYLDDIIYQKIQLLIIDFTIQTNGTYNENKK